MPLEAVSEETNVVVVTTTKTIDVLVDDEVVSSVLAEPEVTVTMPSQEVLVSVETPGPPGDPGIVASTDPPSDPFVGQLWVPLP